ncbi:MAG: hypothetical protein AAGN46_05565 [Acidobacteriota bacterium]
MTNRISGLVGVLVDARQLVELVRCTPPAALDDGDRDSLLEIARDLPIWDVAVRALTSSPAGSTLVACQVYQQWARDAAGRWDPRRGDVGAPCSDIVARVDAVEAALLEASGETEGPASPCSSNSSAPTGPGAEENFFGDTEKNRFVGRLCPWGVHRWRLTEERWFRPPEAVLSPEPLPPRRWRDLSVPEQAQEWHRWMRKAVDDVRRDRRRTAPQAAEEIVRDQCLPEEFENALSKAFVASAPLDAPRAVLRGETVASRLVRWAGLEDAEVPPPSPPAGARPVTSRPAGCPVCPSPPAGARPLFRWRDLADSDHVREWRRWMHAAVDYVRQERGLTIFEVTEEVIRDQGVPFRFQQMLGTALAIPDSRAADTLVSAEKTVVRLVRWAGLEDAEVPPHG